MTPPFLLATKIEAFRERGGGDYLASRDFGDLIALVDGRAELLAEISASPPAVSAYLAEAFETMSADVFFESGVAGALPFDAASQARVPRVRETIREVIAVPR